MIRSKLLFIVISFSILLCLFYLKYSGHFHPLTPFLFAVYILTTILAVKELKRSGNLYSPLFVFVVYFFIGYFLYFLLYSTADDWLLRNINVIEFQKVDNSVKLKTFILSLGGYVAFILGYSIKRRKSKVTTKVSSPLVERFKNTVRRNIYGDFLHIFFLLSIIWLIAKIYIHLYLKIGIMGLRADLGLPWKLQGMIYYFSTLFIYIFLIFYFSTAISVNNRFHIFASLAFLILDGAVEAFILTSRGTMIRNTLTIIIISRMLRVRGKTIYISTLILLCLSILLIPFITSLRYINVGVGELTAPNALSLNSFWGKINPVALVKDNFFFFLMRINSYPIVASIIKYAEHTGKSNMLSSIAPPIGDAGNFYIADMANFYTHEILGVPRSIVIKSAPTLWGDLFMRAGYVGAFIIMFVWGIVNRNIFEHLLKQRHKNPVSHSVFIFIYLLWFYSITSGGDVVNNVKMAWAILFFYIADKFIYKHLTASHLKPSLQVLPNVINRRFTANLKV